MKVNFRDICGNSYILQIPSDAKVADACKILTQKLNIQNNQIFLVSTDENRNFYQDNEKMIDVLKENPDFIIFMKYFIQDQYDSQIKSTENNKNEENTEQNQELKSEKEINNIIGTNKRNFDQMKVPSQIFFETLRDTKDWGFNDIYLDYTIVLNDVPPDFQQKVDQIAELGYSIDDIKEALRTTNYDVSLSIHYLIAHIDNEVIEDDDYESEGYIDDSSEFEYNYYKDNIDLDDENKTEADNNNIIHSEIDLIQNPIECNEPKENDNHMHKMSHTQSSPQLQNQQLDIETI